MRFKKKIIINARFLTQETTGVQRFAIELAKELKIENNIKFVAPKNIIQKELAEQLNVKTNLPLGFLKGHFWEQISLPLYVKMQNGSLLLSLCNTAPIFLKNQIVTIHDIGFKIHPEWYNRKFSFFYNFLIPRILRKSKRIITVSNSSMNNIVQYFGIQTSKIAIVPNATSKVFLNKPLNKNAKTTKYIDLINKKFILTVSSLNPRKNVNKLVEAFQQIDDKSLYLYIIGNFSKNFSDVKINTNERILILNNISDKELKIFYNKAQVFVFPSLYEGFGIPILEAMSQNTTLCVSDIPVFREICKNFVDYFNPNDENDIKNTIEKALNQTIKPTPNRYENILKKYSWEVSANYLEKCIFDSINLD